ncbi:DUF2155 domain-containing protein [Lachnospiraceae bacterium OttesenSCG-928-E19]|nr:DUF2155 domain-containing protein [Lachnospiraceae bacterium OttesenSCG-928-E19]
MKKMILAFLIPVLFMGVNPVDAFVEKQTAVVRIMNKAAGKAQTVSLPVGKTSEFEKLSITVRTCKQTDPFEAEDFWSFFEISKIGDGKIFSGWMSRNEPGENPLQNADYDLWLVSCN